jgi:hypothetical protein
MEWKCATENMLINLKANPKGFSVFEEIAFRKQVNNEEKIIKETAKEAFLILGNSSIEEISKLLLDPKSKVYDCL